MKKDDICRAKKLFSQHRPYEAFRFLARRMGVKNIVFDKLHDAFISSRRIDVFPLRGGKRGFILTSTEKRHYFSIRKKTISNMTGLRWGLMRRGMSLFLTI